MTRFFRMEIGSLCRNVRLALEEHRRGQSDAVRVADARFQRQGVEGAQAHACQAGKRNCGKGEMRIQSAQPLWRGGRVV